MDERPGPGVVVIACVRDEEHFLEAAVQSVLDQDHPAPLDIILAVGPSRDRTQEIADKLAEQNPQVRVIDNPTGSRPVGLNLALAAAPADRPVVVRVDGHTVFAPDYVRRGVATLERTGAAGVGGLMSATGATPTQRAVARAMSHPVGIGSASFHVGGSEGPAETVYLGIFQREAIEQVGGYDDTLFRAEDWDLCLRLRRAGESLWFDPTLVVTYWPRRTLGAVAKQFWRTGMWRREVIRRSPATANLRYLAPPALVVALAVSIGLFAWGVIVGAVPLVVAGIVAPAGYLVVALAGAGVAAVHRPRLEVWPTMILPAVLVVMHLSWGAGFVRGLTARAAVDHRA